MLFHLSRCVDVKASVYDECEYITDDGVDHPIGVTYSVDRNGELVESDFPDIEYEYYE